MLWHKSIGAGGLIGRGDVVYDWDFASPVIDNQIAIGTDTSFPHGFHISYDGNYAFVGDLVAGEVITYSLSTPFDFNSKTKVRTTSFGASQASGCHFKSDGLIFYYFNNTATEVIQQYSLTVAWDLSTASLDKTYTDGTYLPLCQKVFLDETGEHMYAAGGGIFHYTLSTPFDVSTASYSDGDGTLAAGNAGAINQDGTKLFTTDNGTDDLLIYELSTPYNVSTATLSSSFDLSSQTTTLNSGDISRDGVWAYGASNTGDKIIQVEVAP